MADTSELLRLCDRLIAYDADATRLRVDPGYDKIQAITLARALKSRLQAEAPEDARKDEIEIAKHILGLIFPKANDADFKGFVERHGVHIAAIIRADRNAACTSQAEAQAPTTAASVLTEDERAAVADAAEFIDQTQAPVSLRHVSNLYAIIHRLAFTVGASAPAPTTVLTEDELERVKFLRRNIGDWTEADAADVCDLVLRVGAPAPAPAPVLTREQIARLVCYWFPIPPHASCHDNFCVGSCASVSDPYFDKGNGSELIRGLTDTILALAKGDTP